MIMLSLATLALMILGLVFWVLAFRRRSPDFPSLGSASTYHPRNWKPVWMQRNLFALKRGFIYYLIGTLLIVGAGIVRALFAY